LEPAIAFRDDPVAGPAFAEAAAIFVMTPGAHERIGKAHTYAALGLRGNIGDQGWIWFQLGCQCIGSSDVDHVLQIVIQVLIRITQTRHQISIGNRRKNLVRHNKNLKTRT